mmetsp:Transcript_77888/g.252506  ORF Transcript_77888/g.252506 Transcript_77888/m.252506 type:complete len:318 (+) Transcript_77888:2074-3027(+)
MLAQHGPSLLVADLSNIADLHDFREEDHAREVDARRQRLAVGEAGVGGHDVADCILGGHGLHLVVPRRDPHGLLPEHQVPIVDHQLIELVRQRRGVCLEHVLHALEGALRSAEHRLGQGLVQPSHDVFSGPDAVEVVTVDHLPGLKGGHRVLRLPNGFGDGIRHLERPPHLCHVEDHEEVERQKNDEQNDLDGAKGILVAMLDPFVDEELSAVGLLDMRLRIHDLLHPPADAVLALGLLRLRTELLLLPLHDMQLDGVVVGGQHDGFAQALSDEVEQNHVGDEEDAACHRMFSPQLLEGANVDEQVFGASRHGLRQG